VSLKHKNRLNPGDNYGNKSDNEDGILKPLEKIALEEKEEIWI